MNCTVAIDINASKESVWQVIADIANVQEVISGIIAVHILHKPDAGIVGLKWEESRVMFGKEATETMWITDAVENDYYATRAESHGSVYITKVSVAESEGGSRITLSFDAQPQTLSAKLFSFLMSPFLKNAVKKPLEQDLADIKSYIEKHTP